MSNHDDVTEDYLKALVNSIGRSGDNKFWPFEPGQVDSYFIDLLAVNLFEKFRNNQEKFQEGLSSLSPNILRWFLLPFTILGLKLARKYEGYKADESEMTKFIKLVADVLKSRVGDDPFCLNGRNTIWTEKEVEENLEKMSWFEGRERRPVNLLSADIESFIWTINFDVFAYGVFWHGPYSLKDGKTLIAKRFIDLDLPVWDWNSPYSEIELLFVFDGKVDTFIDFMGHITYPNNAWETLRKFAVTINCKPVTKLEELKNLSEHFSQKRDEQLTTVNSLPPEKIIQKGAEIYYYMFHKLFDYYKEDWRPPEEFEKRLSEWGLKYWNQFISKGIERKQPDESFFRRLYDPRNDFTD